ncbi:MAG: stage II sporulation protein R [Clostridia bacterium]|nr:stage II sporulation protein R [Clostridia bacterium]MDE7329320.1 stage II sporulation protein R [Clostridia bacterium]
MKVAAVIILCVILLGAVIMFAKTQSQSPEDTYLRIHIRANSNDATDQSVKYKVKESIVEYMTPKLEGVADKSQAMTILSENLDEMKVVADAVLSSNGYDYESTVSIRQEEFPVRSYGDLTLESGIYDALIIELGSGSGDNWWCVVFPPLCFVGKESENFEYKSLFFN